MLDTIRYIPSFLVDILDSLAGGQFRGLTERFQRKRRVIDDLDTTFLEAVAKGGRPSIGGSSDPVLMTGVVIHGKIFDMLYSGRSIEVEDCCCRHRRCRKCSGLSSRHSRDLAPLARMIQLIVENQNI